MQPNDLSMRGLFTPAFVARAGVLAVLPAAALLLSGGGAPVAPHLHWPRLTLLAQAGPVVDAHVAAAVLALLVGAVLLRRRKGTRWHKRLGWTWVVAMAVVVASSFFVRGFGHFSWIHAISGYVSVLLVLGVRAIRRGAVARHRALMTGVFLGGLVIAGAFTFVPGRLMYAVFFG